MATKIDQILQVWVSLNDYLFKDMTMLCQISPHALSPGTSSLIGKHSTQTLSAQKVLSLDSSSRNRMNSTHQFVLKVRDNKGKRLWQTFYQNLHRKKMNHLRWLLQFPAWASSSCLWHIIRLHRFNDMTMLCGISTHTLCPGRNSSMSNHSTQILSAQKVLSCLIRVRVRETGWIPHTNSFERSRRKGSKTLKNQKTNGKKV